MKSRIDKMRFGLGKQKQMTMEAEKILITSEFIAELKALEIVFIGVG